MVSPVATGTKAFVDGSRIAAPGSVTLKPSGLHDSLMSTFFRRLTFFAFAAFALVPPPAAVAEAIFEGAFPRSLVLAPGGSAVLQLPIRNTSAAPANAALRLQAFILPRGTYRVSAASDCPVPSLFLFDPPVIIELQPAELRTCAYEISRALGPANDTVLSFVLGGFEAQPPERIRSVAVGDLVELRTGFTPTGPARLVEGEWRQTGEWRIENLGPSDLISVRYASCRPIPSMPRIVSVGPECEFATTTCFEFQPPTGVMVGPLAAGQTRSCRVEVAAPFLPFELELRLQDATKAVGGEAEMIDPLARSLIMRGSASQPPHSVSTLSSWTSLLLVLAFLGIGAQWLRR